MSNRKGLVLALETIQKHSSARSSTWAWTHSTLDLGPRRGHPFWKTVFFILSGTRSPSPFCLYVAVRGGYTWLHLARVGLFPMCDLIPMGLHVLSYPWGEACLYAYP